MYIKYSSAIISKAFDNTTQTNFNTLKSLKIHHDEAVWSD